jgi:hypothetical protein
MPKIHNFDLVDHQEPIYFDSAKDAIKHLSECGYWSAPIQFKNQSAAEYFSSRYKATDWATSRALHYRKS